MSLTSEADSQKLKDLKEETIMDWITEYLMFKDQFDAVSDIHSTTSPTRMDTPIYIYNWLKTLMQILDVKHITAEVIKSYIKNINKYFISESNDTAKFIKRKLLSVLEKNNTQINSDKLSKLHEDYTVKSLKESLTNLAERVKTKIISHTIPTLEIFYSARDMLDEISIDEYGELTTLNNDDEDALNIIDRYNNDNNNIEPTLDNEEDEESDKVESEEESSESEEEEEDDDDEPITQQPIKRKIDNNNDDSSMKEQIEILNKRVKLFEEKLKSVPDPIDVIMNEDNNKQNNNKKRIIKSYIKSSKDDDDEEDEEKVRKVKRSKRLVKHQQFRHNKSIEEEEEDEDNDNDEDDEDDDEYDVNDDDEEEFTPPIITSKHSNDSISSDASSSDKYVSPLKQLKSEVKSMLNQSNTRNNNNNNSSKLPFSSKENLYLINGVEKYGIGKWKEILLNYPFHEKRTSTNLKDRYRNIERKAERYGISIKEACNI